MGRPGSSAASSGGPPKATPPGRRVLPPASIAFDRDHGQPPATGHGPWRERDAPFGACCFAGKLCSPAGESRVPLRLGPRPYADPTPATRVPLIARTAGSCWLCPSLGPVVRGVCGRLAPLGGVERPRRTAVSACRSATHGDCEVPRSRYRPGKQPRAGARATHVTAQARPSWKC
jgi:hypothetical protein